MVSSDQSERFGKEGKYFPLIREKENESPKNY